MARDDDWEDFDIEALDPGVDNITVYVPPGPDSQRFLAERTPTKFLMGPVGGGKTTTLAFDRIMDGAAQGCAKDGWVRDRALVLRRSWRTAKRTVLKSWQEWFPKGYAGSTWTGGEDRPAVHVLRFEDPIRKCKIELETEFMGLDDNNIDQILRGSPYSRIWLNEADQFSKDIVEECEGRIGRYPRMDDLAEGERRRKSLNGDFNAPDKTNYLNDLLIEHPRPGRVLHMQPPGLLVTWNADGTLADYRINPAAENLSKLDPDYYTSKAATWEEWRVRRLILNEWGYSREGLPVFVKEFVERLHVAPKIIAPERGLPLIIGVDVSTGGLRPAAVFMQPDSSGQLRVIETVAPGHGYGAVRFFEIVLATMESGYRGVPYIEVWTDPAAQYGGDREGGSLAAIETGSVILGVPLRVPAGGSNEIGLRLDAVRGELNTVVEGERRRLIISPHPSNRILIAGLASGYRFKKRPPQAPTTWEALPEKNEYSDPLDAMGYGVLGLRRTMPHTLARDGQRWAAGERSKSGWSGGKSRGPSPWAARAGDFDVFKM
jgi:hypothetical protein